MVQKHTNMRKYMQNGTITHQYAKIYAKWYKNTPICENTCKIRARPGEMRDGMAGALVLAGSSR